MAASFFRPPRTVTNAGMPVIDQAVSEYNLNEYYSQALNLVVSGRAREAFEDLLSDVERRRREAARHALEHTSASVKAVAFSLGFRYASHFCAWFKEGEDRTPTDFRRRRNDVRE